MPSASSPTSCTRPRAAGPSAPTPATSSTTTSSTKAATSPPGNNPTCSPPRCGQHSKRCADSVVEPGLVSPNGGRPAFGAGGQIGVPPAHQAGVPERGTGELHRRGTRVGGGAHVVPVQDVLTQGLIPTGTGRGQAGARKAGRRRMCVGEKRRPWIADIPRPPADLDQLGIRCVTHDEVIGRRGGGQAGEQEHRQVKSA